MKKHRRAVILALALLFLLPTVFSAVLEAAHDHTGDACPVCALCAAIKSFGRLGPVSVFCLYAAVTAGSAPALLNVIPKAKKTIEQKNKLLN